MYRTETHFDVDPAEAFAEKRVAPLLERRRSSELGWTRGQSCIRKWRHSRCLLHTNPRLQFVPSQCRFLDSTPLTSAHGTIPLLDNLLRSLHISTVSVHHRAHQHAAGRIGVPVRFWSSLQRSKYDYPESWSSSTSAHVWIGCAGPRVAIRAATIARVEQSPTSKWPFAKSS